MKTYTFTAFLVLILFSCGSDSYTAAQNQNFQRFEGVERENAQYLMKAHDLIMLTEAFSELAMGEAELRSTYILAEEAHTLANELQEQFHAQARSKEIVLPDELSATNSQYLQELQQMQEEGFDKAYYRLMIERLNDISELSADYLKHGQNERLLNFARDLQEQTRDLAERFEQVDIL